MPIRVMVVETSEVFEAFDLNCRLSWDIWFDNFWKDSN
jgi:hypothetical protein